ncbi:hypothetical protein D5086_010403 [Populus alba]|uniref:Uncharacterized protein n=2 Tax=Populus alba TaxID=43335 RepID=A0ACC4C9R2_POPAL
MCWIKGWRYGRCKRLKQWSLRPLLHPVNLEAKERPNIIDIVANMERALALCEEVRSSRSTTTLSIPSG